MVVRLRNLEYDLTSAIRKVTQGFQSVESLLSRSSTPIKVNAYLSKATYPDALKQIPESVTKAAEILAERSKGLLTIQIKDPDSDIALQNQLRQAYGFQPLSLGLFSDQQFWSFIVVERWSRHPSAIAP